jgi:hypothetical protein
MRPLQAPSSSVTPHLAPSPRVGPSRDPAPRVRPSQTPSSRVSPSPVPSPGVGPTLAPPAMQSTPNYFRRDPPSPTAHAPSPRGSSQHGHGIPGTNLYGNFADVVEEEHAPPQHRTRSRSQTARHRAHVVQSIPVANAVIHATTGANMEYRGLNSGEETFPIWDHASVNEFGRLAQGVDGRIEGSNTVFYFPLGCPTKQNGDILWTICCRCATEKRGSPSSLIDGRREPHQVQW